MAADTSTRFDVRGFARTASGNHRADMPLEAFSTAPLDAETLLLVRYLGRLESATMEHLRNLLVTATHKDARVTAFLVTWAFEKFWIADALDAVLEANGVPRAQDLEEGKPRHAASESQDRKGPINRAIRAIQRGVPIIAVHTTTGLVDEWVMRDAYRQLAQEGKSEPLSSTVDMILAIKKRHMEFFDEESRRRLAESSKSVSQTRTELMHAAWPIGAVNRAADDRTMFENIVFGGTDGAARAAAIGTLIAALPGLDNRVGSAVSERLVP